MKTFPLGREGKVWVACPSLNLRLVELTLLPFKGGSILLAATQDNPEDTEKMKKLFFAAQEFMDTVQDKKAAILVSLASLQSVSNAPLVRD
jgi:hypothetical protein